MANTYSQSYFQIVFAVKNRKALIQKEWKSDLEKYITGIVQNNGHKLIAIGGTADHIHIFIGYNLNQLIPKLVEQIKTSTNAWIKHNSLSKFYFEWQVGYGAFTYAHSQIESVVKYVLNQEEHHKKQSFKEEYLSFLKEFRVEYKDEYLFDFLD